MRTARARRLRRSDLMNRLFDRIFMGCEADFQELHAASKLHVTAAFGLLQLVPRDISDRVVLLETAPSTHFMESAQTVVPHSFPSSLPSSSSSLL